jgi:hypothetical protein
MASTAVKKPMRSKTPKLPFQVAATIHRLAESAVGFWLVSKVKCPFRFHLRSEAMVRDVTTIKGNEAY